VEYLEREEKHDSAEVKDKDARYILGYIPPEPPHGYLHEVGTVGYA
jgi:hypothetical protein